jgi:hypothetical protein
VCVCVCARARACVCGEGGAGTSQSVQGYVFFSLPECVCARSTYLFLEKYVSGLTYVNIPFLSL